jgi:hypothetical protein
MTVKNQRHLPNEVSKLEARVEKASSRTASDYEKALKTVKELKNMMIELKRNISQKEQAGTDRDLSALDLTLKRLNRFSDSLILRSKKA